MAQHPRRQPSSCPIGRLFIPFESVPNVSRGCRRSWKLIIFWLLRWHDKWTTALKEETGEDRLYEPIPARWLSLVGWRMEPQKLPRDKAEKCCWSSSTVRYEAQVTRGHAGDELGFDVTHISPPHICTRKSTWWSEIVRGYTFLSK
jgi:hypothetical protein